MYTEKSCARSQEISRCAAAAGDNKSLRANDKGERQSSRSWQNE
jgi:hypothetical protein